MKTSNLITYGALTLVSLLYGINYSVLKVVIPEYAGAFGFIAFRVTTAAAIFWIFFLPKIEKVNWKNDGVRILLCTLTGIAVNQLLFYKGISLTSAVNGSIIMTLTPVLVLMWSGLILKERITGIKIAGIILGLVGAVVIIYQQGAEIAGNWRGDVLVFLNGTSYALYLVLVKPLMAKYRPMTIVTWIFTLGIIFVWPVGFQEARNISFSSFPPHVWGSVAFAIIGVTVIVYFLNAWTLTKVNPSVVGAFIYLQPIFATGTAILFFSEVFLLKHMIASAFVFTGVWLVTKKSRSTSS